MGNRMWAVVLRYGVPDEPSVREVAWRVESVRDRDQIEPTVPRAPEPVVAGRIPAGRESLRTPG